jgi:chloramphenicol O-acetyltransferase type A
VYVLSQAVNVIPEFQYRIRAGKVVEHEIVHPSTTILTDEDLFSFCPIDYTEDFSLFAARAAEQIGYRAGLDAAHAKLRKCLLLKEVA